MSRIAKAIEKCLFESKWKPTEDALEELETIDHSDYGQPELDADGFLAEEEKWVFDSLTGTWIAPMEPVLYPEPDNVYFYSGKSPVSTFDNLEPYSIGYKQDTDNWQCPYCNSLHSLTKYRCANCGAVRIGEY